MGWAGLSCSGAFLGYQGMLSFVIFSRPITSTARTSARDRVKGLSSPFEPRDIDNQNLGIPQSEGFVYLHNMQVDL